MAREGGKDRGLFERIEKCRKCNGAEKGCDACNHTGRKSWGWCVEWYDQNGRRHRETCPTKTAARALHARRRAAVEEYRCNPEAVAAKRKKKLLLADATKLYRDEGATLHPRDWKRHEKIWTEAFPAATLEEITTRDLELWRAKRQKAVKPATVARDLAWLKHLFNLAIRDKHATENPVSAVRLKRPNNERVRYLKDEENEEARLRAKMDPADWPMVEFAFLTGLRRSEQFGMKWEHVDLGRRTLLVPRSKHGEKRHIPLSDRAHALLTALPSRGSSTWVFPSRTGKTPLDADNWVKRKFVPAVKAAELENFHWHDLRHDFASKLVMAGADLYAVKELMGHKSIQMTQRYAHLSPKRLLDTANLIGASKAAEP